MLKKFKELSVYILPFMLAVFIYAFVTNFQGTLGVLGSVWYSVSYVLTRFLIGFGVAYMLNFLVEFLRKRLRFGRAPAIAVTYLFFFGVIVVLVNYIIPMIVDSVEHIFHEFMDAPRHTENLIAWLGGVFPALDQETITMIREFSAQLSGNVTGLLRDFLTFANVTDFISTFTRHFLNIMFGIVISVYALVEKPRLIRRVKHFIYAVFPDRRAGRIIADARESNRIFSSFLVGRILESLAVGLICLPLYYIFGVPFAPFLALIAAVTNIVPYFGPLVGGVITGLILLFFNPVQAITAVAIIAVINVITAYYLGPRILSNAVGISPLLVIVAILIGGDLFGFMGIFLGVPVMAVLKTMLFDRFVDKRLERKRLQRAETGEPPPELLDDFVNIDIPPEKKKRRKIRFGKKK